MTFLFLSSDQMGTGDPELGRKLLKSFLAALAAGETRVDVVGCANSGVFLTTEGSEVLESLQALEAKGARIASCGVCLEHYGRGDKLLIGEVGNTEMSVQVMTTADRVIQP